MKVLWGITGSGEKIEDTVNIMLMLQKKHDLDIRLAMHAKPNLTVFTLLCQEVCQKVL